MGSNEPAVLIVRTREYMLVILLVKLVSMRITITFRLIKVNKTRSYRMPKKGFEPLLYRYEWYVLTD